MDGLDSTVTTNKVVINEINFSANSTENQTFGVSSSGALQFTQAPRTFGLSVGAFGNANATDYFGLGPNVAPGDFWAVPVGPVASVLTSYSMRLCTNVPFNLGGVGSCSLQVGYINPDTTCTTANFVTLDTTVINVTNDLYQVSNSGLNIAIPANSGLVCRIFTIGTSATATNAELALSVTIQ